MPTDPATRAARLSVAPMMDGNDLGVISVIYGATCATHVHVLIV